MNRNFSLAILTLLVIALLLSYIYLWNLNAKKSAVTESCVNLCKKQLNESKSLSSGPCISEEIAKSWVCDVAHNPRQEIDNLPENQCGAYVNGTARHFVEINENCKVIRTI